jgi:kynureninase
MAPTLTRDDMMARDAADPLRAFRDEFVIPANLIYFDGNSLGALPRAAAQRVARVIEQEWGHSLISSWNDHGWIDLPLATGRRIAGLIGAAPDEVVVCDSVSVNLFKTLSAAIALRPGRTVIVTDPQDFPTDVYIVEGLCRLLGQRFELRVATPEAVNNVLGDDVAVATFRHVNYKTASLADMAAITSSIHAAGALAVWDLSHSAGALPVELDRAAADFAVGCGYKYLNGGPGAPAFLFAARRHHDAMRQPLSGWLGHAAPFAFHETYVPAPGIARMLTGTPPVLSMSALDAAVGLIDRAGIDRLRSKSVEMTSLLIDLVEQECAGFGLVLGSPRTAQRRGSHVIFHHPEGYAVVQALKARGVIGDFRTPDCIRLGIAPIYLSFAGIWDAVQHLKAVMQAREWDRDAFKIRAAVT